MNKKDFQSLLKGTKELGQMLRGKIESAREFIHKVDIVKLNKNSQPVWAVCVVDEDDALVPLKMYEARLSSDGKYVRVRDEEGEAFVCPGEWFIFLSLPKEVKAVLKKVA
jgi:hypothetical protein